MSCKTALAPVNEVCKRVDNLCMGGKKMWIQDSKLYNGIIRIFRNSAAQKTGNKGGYEIAFAAYAG